MVRRRFGRSRILGISSKAHQGNGADESGLQRSEIRPSEDGGIWHGFQYEAESHHQRHPKRGR